MLVLDVHEVSRNELAQRMSPKLRLQTAPNTQVDFFLLLDLYDVIGQGDKLHPPVGNQSEESCLKREGAV